MDLNPPQLTAVHHVTGPLLVLAGAGSGKTRVITAKIVHLLRAGTVEPEQVFAVTFTNRAAREMSERITASAGAPGSRVSVSTFHRLGLRILRESPDLAGLRAGFSIFNAGDSESLLRELLRMHWGGQVEASALREAARAAQSMISSWKNALITPEQAAAEARSTLDRTHAAVYRDYQSHLGISNAVDFDDLLLQPVRILTDHSERRALWQARVRYLLVDEYQDTNGAQYELIRLLTGNRAAFTVVGDDDQSIYAWRGARPDNLLALTRDFPELVVVKLEQNYRSRGNILRTANKLIGHNPHLFEKRLWSERGPGNPVRIVQVEDDEAEADRIASEILQRQLQRQGQWRDFAVIYRSNYQVRRLELRLQALNVPYRISGGGSFFDRGEIRDALAYLRLLVNPDDDGALLRVVNVPRRQIGASTLAAVQKVALARRCSLLRAIRDPELADDVSSAGLRRVRQFRDWLLHWRQQLHQPAQTLRGLLEDADYQGWLLQQAPDRSRGQQRWASVELLLGSIARLAAEGQSAEEVLRSLVLEDAMEQEDEDEIPDQVQLLTLHASKGLEFPHVYMMGCEEGLLPHRNSTTEEQICEERRLAYVGITRAMETLTMVVTRKRRLRGEVLATEPSRFLAELPADHIQWEGREDEPEDRREERAQQSLSALKAMLED